MNDQEFKEKIAKIAYIYRDMYGVYPNKMYVSKYRLQSLQQYNMIFPEPPPLREIDPSIHMFITPHTTALIPALHLKLDDVYVEAIEFESEIILRSAEQLERMAKADVT